MAVSSLKSAHRTAGKPRPLMLILGIGLLLCSVSTAEPVRIAFRDSVAVNDTVILLSDIAEITGDNQKYINSLGSVITGEAAPPGFSRFVGVRDLMQYRIRSRFPECEYELAGPGRIRVKTACRKYCINDFEKEIRAYVNSRLSRPREQYSFSIENSSKTWKCLDKPLSITVEGLKDRHKRGRVSMNLRVCQEGSSFTVPFTALIRVRVPVVVASGEISRGETVSRENCRLEERDITFFRSDVFTELDGVSNHRSRRSIPAGRIISGASVEPIPLIKKGDRIMILMEKANIRISIPGRACQPGALGEKIWVRNSRSNTMLKAEIIGTAEVRIL